MRELSVIVADDERPARRRLEELVRRTPGCRLAGAFGDGGSALRKIRSAPPDIAFLDIRMPGVDGVEIARRLAGDEPPEVVLVTASRDHALEAFDSGVTDYLLKPFDDERFARTIERCREKIRRRDLEREGEAPPLRRLVVDDRGRRVLIDLDDIAWIGSAGPYVEIHVDGGTHLLRESLSTLDARLPEDEFCRIHRSVIVRLDRIVYLESKGRGDWSARLEGGRVLPVSRTRTAELERRLGTL